MVGERSRPHKHVVRARIILLSADLLPPEIVERVVTLTCSEAPGEATHWTGRIMAKAVGISLRSVQRIWATHRLGACA